MPKPKGTNLGKGKTTGTRVRGAPVPRAMPARPPGYFGGGAGGLARRQAYQAARGASARAANMRQLSGAMTKAASMRGAIGRGGGPGAANRQALRSTMGATGRLQGQRQLKKAARGSTRGGAKF